MDLFDLLCVFLLFLAGAVMEESSINPPYPFAIGRNSFYPIVFGVRYWRVIHFICTGNNTWTWFNIYKKEKNTCIMGIQQCFCCCSSVVQYSITHKSQREGRPSNLETWLLPPTTTERPLPTVLRCTTQYK